MSNSHVCLFLQSIITELQFCMSYLHSETKTSFTIIMKPVSTDGSCGKLLYYTGDAHLLLSSAVEINGRPLRFLNDLDIDNDGNVYFTDSSIYQRRDFFLDVLDGRATGRYLSPFFKI